MSDPPSRCPDPVLDIVPYDSSWPSEFERERALLEEALPSVLSIEHVGSTSVPGMPAKPTLDILVVLPVAREALERAEQLAAIGYDHQPAASAADCPPRCGLSARRTMCVFHRSIHGNVLPAGGAERLAFPVAPNPLTGL
jgi:GrpB-like predicted nucleotidyltransferase (UPF0157 family)